MHKGIDAAQRSTAPNSRRLLDWAHVTGATSQGPAGLAGALLKHLSAVNQKETRAYVLQWCRLSKSMPRFLFHVVWNGVFDRLTLQGERNAVTALQRDYFVRDADGVWDANWRSSPGCIMPGTDVGSAPQESWHNSTLIPACQQVCKDPYSLAVALQNKIVKKLLNVLKEKTHQQQGLQDWPAIGQFVDQHCLRNTTALAREGRTAADSLLQWSLHSRYCDPQGNVWMLVPTSRHKVDWARSGRKSKCKSYKARQPVQLVPDAAKHFAAAMTAESVQQVEQALEKLQIYDRAQHVFPCWRSAAKTFDDWRCVLHGGSASVLEASPGVPP